jgi:RecA-family ATPase
MGLKTEHFYREKIHRKTYKAILKIHDRGEAVDLVTVVDETKFDNEAVAELNEMIDSVPTAENVEHYARIVMEMAERRLVISQAIHADDLRYDIEKLRAEYERIQEARPRDKESEEYKNLADLEKTEFPPIKWIAEPYIPEGVTLFVGKPKLGKSWLMLNLALSVACGGKFLSSIDVEQGAVLYLDLDGNERRLKRRTAQILQGGPFPKDFYYDHRHERGAIGVKRIAGWLDRCENARLVIIDTFVKFRELSGGRSVNIYEKDTHDLDILEKLSDAHQIGIICVHHAGKSPREDIMDEASGSTGLGGGANTLVRCAGTPLTGGKSTKLCVGSRRVS